MEIIEKTLKRPKNLLLCLLYLDRDPVRHSKPLDNTKDNADTAGDTLGHLTLHILDHGDHSLESRAIHILSVICHDLPTFPHAQGLLDMEGDLLLFSSFRTGVSETKIAPSVKMNKYISIHLELCGELFLESDCLSLAALKLADLLRSFLKLLALLIAGLSV